MATNQTIKIKRTTGASKPSTVEPGELVYAYDTSDTGGTYGKKLFIGDPNSNTGFPKIIGGEYFTEMLDHSKGVLTASSAIIVNENKEIDNIIVGVLDLKTDTISSSGDININATNSLVLENQFWPSSPGINGYFLKTDNSGVLEWAAVPSGSFTIVDDNSGTDVFTTGETLTFSQGTGTTVSVTDNKITFESSTNLTASATGTSLIITSDTGTNASIPAATTSAWGAMTDEDKEKLNTIEPNANNYTLPEATATTRGGIELFSNVDQTVAANAVSFEPSRTYGVQLNSAGQAVVNVPWIDTDTNTTYSAGVGLSLDGTTFNANVDATVQVVSATGVSATASRTYALQVDESNNLVVNVPWVNTDTNTTYSAGVGLSLDGTTFKANVAAAEQTVNANTVTNTASRTYAVQVDGADNLVVNVPWTVYTLPEATATTRGGIELFSNVDQTVAANDVSAVAARTYGIQLNSSGQAVVNVPWANTTYSAGKGLTLTGTTFDANVDATEQTVDANTVSSATSRTYAVQVDGNDKLVVNVPWTDSDVTLVSSETPALDYLTLTGQEISMNFIDLETDVTGALPNSNLENSSITVGTTVINLGGASTTIEGLTSLEVDNVTIGDTDNNTISTSTGNLILDSEGGTVSVNDNLVVQGYLAGPAQFTIDPAAIGDDTGEVIIKGNLTVQGNTTTINSTAVEIADITLELARNAASDIEADGSGIIFGGHSPNAATFTYDATDDRLVASNVNGIEATTFVGDLTGNASSATTSSGLSSGDISDTGIIVGTDYLFFFDGGAGGSSAKVSVVDFVSGIAGVNISAASGQLSVATATTTTRGVASFEPTQFDVASGEVSLAVIDGGTYI